MKNVIKTYTHEEGKFVISTAQNQGIDDEIAKLDWSHVRPSKVLLKLGSKL